MTALRTGLSHLVLLGIFAAGGCDTARPFPDAEPVEITLLVVYPASVAEEAGDVAAMVDRAIAETNEVYRNGSIDVRLKLARLEPVDYQITERLQDLWRFVRKDDGFLDEIHAMRDASRADVGVLLSPDRSSTINAAVLAEESTAFVVVFWETLGAPDYALAHEIGHLQGARHTPDRDPATVPFPFGHGFRNDTLKTIMATGGQRVVPYFSGPDQVYNGVVLGDSTASDVARVLRETSAYVSNFRGPRTETDFVPPGTWPTVNFGSKR